MSPATAQLGAANTAVSDCHTAIWLRLLQPAARLRRHGRSVAGHSAPGTSTTTKMQSPMSNILGGMSSGIGLLSFLSDERAKENIEEVGELHDGQPVYRYSYKGMPERDSYRAAGAGTLLDARAGCGGGLWRYRPACGELQARHGSRGVNDEGCIMITPEQGMAFMQQMGNCSGRAAPASVRLRLARQRRA
jgi:hypothetical protein